ncbi:MAG: IS200/IS605 family transposase [Hyphomicrobium sp.]|uniref:IS200/IS605 family transposase n=1 Tax=Hyphomicrobium sp. TaxID=82 RepID=UPI003569E77F
MKEAKCHSNSHSKYLIKLHFVLAIKYRKKLLKGELNDDLIQIIYEICNEKGYLVDALQSDIDHLHILVDVEPKVSALEIAHQIKQISMFRIYKKHKEFLKKHFWKKNILWSEGYFVCSTGDASTKTIQKYIEEQG